jgi:hypothetical protein
MTDADWTTIVQKILNRERSSLLQFAGEAYPWANSAEEAATTKLKRIIDEEQAAEIRLANFLARHHLPQPSQVSFPLRFTSLMFVSLDYLLPQLLDEQRQAITQLKVDMAAITAVQARQQVEQLLALKERHLKELEELTAETAKTASHA